MAKQTIADKLAAADFNGYVRGKRETEQRFSELKQAQVQAITKLIEESGRVMSRAGYMLGKLNGDNSR